MPQVPIACLWTRRVALLIAGILALIVGVGNLAILVTRFPPVTAVPVVRVVAVRVLFCSFNQFELQRMEVPTIQNRG